MKLAFVLVALVACGGRTGLAQGGGGGDAGADALVACTSEIIATDPNGATALALDGDDVFWGTTDGLVEKRDSGGTGVLASEASSIDAVAIDATRVYYTTTGVLHAVPRAGGPATVIATKLGQPFALTLDSSTGSFFVLDYGAGITAGRVLRIEMDGTLSELLNGLDVPTGLTVDATSVFVAAKAVLMGGQLVDGPLLQIPKVGGLGAALLTGLHSPSSVAVDASRVYFIEQLDAQSTLHGGLRATPKGGGNTTTLAQTPDVMPLDVFVDASAYVTTYSAQIPNQSQGTLLRVALDGSATTQLAATPGVLYGAVRTSPTAVYWTINWLTGQAPADRASVRKLCK